MRIGNGYQGIGQLFSSMNGGKTAIHLPFRNPSRQAGSGVINTLEDFLSGHRKNSYGVEGIGVTGRTDCKRIIPVSKDMKQLVFNRVKHAFYKYNGMSGDNEAELDAFYGQQNAYFNTLKTKDRAAASWTLQQLRVGLCQSVSSAVEAKVPGWTVGKPIPTAVLDEIFADERITSMVFEESDTTKTFDVKI